MAELATYLKKRGINDEQMRKAREHTKAAIDAYNLRQARKASCMTQVELAKAMGGLAESRIAHGEWRFGHDEP